MPVGFEHGLEIIIVTGVALTNLSRRMVYTGSFHQFSGEGLYVVFALVVVT